MQLRSEDYESEYPLHHAIANRDIDEALLLLKDNNYVDQKDEGLYSPIFNAIVFDIESVVFRMVELGADLAIQNPYGDTPLHIATKYENLKYMELFIRKGAPINMKNYLGQSPLFKAVNSNNLIVADYLVQSGANLKLKNRYGLDVYDVAAELDNLNFLKKYKFPKDTSVNELDTQSSLLHIAIENDSMEVANYLIDHGDIEPLDEKQNTPLFTAVFKNNIGIVEKLLKNGVNVNHKNKYNRTPLFYTYTNTRSAIVELWI